MASEKLSSRGQAWFCTTGLPSDVVIEVGEMSFHLHKFPLMSKSKKLNQLITEREQHPNLGARRQTTEEEEEEGKQHEEEIQEEEEEEEEDLHSIALPDFPGGSETFEIAAKFCYGVKIEMTAMNVPPLRCAAEYLEMTEEFAEENLIARTERFLAQSVLRNIKESVKALKSCEDLVPQAEDLGITQRCIEAIAAKAGSSDPSSLFGWPIKGEESKISASAAGIWKGIDAGIRRKCGARSISAAAAAAAAAAGDSWFEDLAVLSLPIYKRVISAMRSRDLSSDLIEGTLISYAKRSFPGLSRSNRHHAPSNTSSEEEQRELLETVISNLPQEKTSGPTATVRFLFGLLRTVSILHASEDSRTALERKIAWQLEKATVDDLLLPSYSYLVETLYDVDCVERILKHFLENLEESSETGAAEEGSVRSQGGNDTRALTAVGKLVDGYLAEIASDGNLKPNKFCDLALALPDQARVFDDGLYRAVDIYLKAHPGIAEEERERVAGVMDCQKLTLEACTHAAQNERLPLRAVVQVLFFEQLQLRRAIAGTIIATEAAAEEEGDVGSGRRRAAMRGSQVLRLDMDSMRSRVNELEKECSLMRKAIEKMDRRGGGGGGSASVEGTWGTMVTRRFGCKFRPQVCDSQQRTVVAPLRKPHVEQSP